MTLNQLNMTKPETPKGKTMSHIASNKPKIGLAVTTALASLALSGCAGISMPFGGKSASAAAPQERAVQAPSPDAVNLAEAGVQADPKNASLRSKLGSAYLKAGRFQSAATAFGDAISLGDTAPRTVLSYSLAETAIGNNKKALEALKKWRNGMDPADLGLAFALAGDPASGVQVLGNTLREGNSTAKVRQNLAYAYALQGNWRSARLMAAEDVPADQINDRIAEWAATVRPEAYQTRVANLLRVKPAKDNGLPAQLALSNITAAPVKVAAAPAPSKVDMNGELPAIAAAAATSTRAPKIAPRITPKIAVAPAPVARPKAPVRVPAASAEAAVKRTNPKIAMDFGSPVEQKPTVGQARKPAPRVAAAAAPRPVRQSRYTSNPQVQQLPSGYRQAPKAAPKPASAPRVVRKAPKKAPVVAAKPPKRAAPAVARAPEKSTHLVQLGSFENRAVAREASRKLQKKHRQLSGRDMVITEARVKGKTYWRVAATGFGERSAQSACRALKGKGQACFSYAASHKLPGAVDRGIRIAAR
jgi:Flp pilus assembly protein TadD